ncbi:long-chain fatty acid--CoA ligase [Paraburkholderia solisilvae]|uniref:Long-chain-fatty-acid--CoA ligase n=1 Tax=Paraburkholderia solisilvae TaxID=624376 RepID=A0A6J5DB50_9BURK|nr:long-chain fatty acid--CoA ligase [Paraburkholderia solisilvae]CAB3750006.1 Long-chain-fatty-acid--CoA ligase [Paraburkholderia solisilvae]
MQKIWLKSYPPGVPAEIDPTQYASVAGLLDDSFSRYRDKPAFACMGKEITYGELDELSRRLGAWFQSKGLERGARIALMMPNVLQYPVALAAVLRAGYVVVNVNPLYTPRELQYQMTDSGAQAIIVLENFAATVQAVIGNTPLEHVIVASMGDLLGPKGHIVNFVVRRVKKLVPAWSLPGHVKFNDALAAGARLPFKPAQQGPDDIAFLQYTGGTTGVSKGATLTHRNLIANVLQSVAWHAPANAARSDIKQTVTLVALPLYHVFALTVAGLMPIRQGGLGVLIPNPRDIGGMIKALRGYKITTLPAVNTLFNAMLNHPDFDKLDLSNLTVANAGGMAVQQAVAERWFARTKTPIIEGYGLSETSPSATCNPVTATEYNGTIGLPLSSTEISIRDDDGNEVPLGQPGEVCIRGPQVMAGYWNRPEETARVMTADGFLRSGDIGQMDERGFVKIVDRKKDMILVSGFNVYPNEVEDVVARHPGVFEVAAVGVPDPQSGEAVKLYVVKKDETLTDADLIAFCKDQLTPYKRPRIVEFRKELPKSNVGKILRRELRDGRA